MKIRKKLFSLILLINLTFVFSYGGIIGCGQTKELKQSQTEKNNINKFIPNNKDKVNRLTQIKPLNTEVIQDESVLYKCDLQRTGVFKGENPKLKGEVLWSFETKEEKWTTDPKYTPKRSSPIIFEDILYIGSIDHNMYAIDANTGKLKWSFKTDGPNTSSPALWNRTLYFGSEDGVFYAVNIDTQKLRWKYKTDGPIYSSPAIAEKMVFFGSTDGTFYALDALTGEEKWKFYSENKICDHSPAIWDGKVFFVMNEARAMENDWLRMGFLSSFSFANNTEGLTEELLIDNSCILFAFDLKTGREEWNIIIDGISVSAPCIYNNTVYLGFKQRINIINKKWQTSYLAGVIAIDANDKSPTFKEILWYHECSIFYSNNLELSISEKALCAGGEILYAFELKSGELRWHYVVKPQPELTPFNLTKTPPAFNSDGSIVYFGDNYGCIHAVNAETGKETSSYIIPWKENENNIETESMYIITFPVFYKGKIYIYTVEELWNTEDLGDRREVGVLYCLR